MTVSSYFSRRSRKRRPCVLPGVFGTGTLLAVGLLVFMFGCGGDDATVAQHHSHKPHQSSQPPPENTNNVLSAPPAQEPPVVPVDPQPMSSWQLVDSGEARSKADSNRTLGDLIDQADTDLSEDNGVDDRSSKEPRNDQPEPTAPAHPARFPVPDNAAQRRAEEQIRQIFDKEFADAKTPDRRLALSAMLLLQADEMKEDPTARYVLMRMACETAADVGELSGAMGVVDRMQKIYELDPLAVKAYIIGKAIVSKQPGSNTSDAVSRIAKITNQLSEQAVADDNFEMASRFAKLVLSVARKTKNTQLVRQATKRGREIDRLKTRFDSVKRALDSLSDTPDDAGANRTVGRWYCFIKGNWSKGLPYLVKVDSYDLAELAKQDIGQPTDPKEQVTLADGWWDLAKKESDFFRSGVQSRSVFWYERALPKLTGLDKVRINRRLESLVVAEKPPTTGIRGVIQKGNVALARNGTKVTGIAIGSPNLLNGDTRTLRSALGCAYGKWPCEWTITLGKVYQLREIRFKLYDIDKRYYRYAIATSPDGKNFSMLEDRSKGQWFGWQQIRFTARSVKAIKLVGLYNSATKNFAAVELEAYCILPPR